MKVTDVKRIPNDLARSGNPGVYTIVNTITKRTYIGSSTQPLRRLKIHVYALRMKTHRNKYLQEDWATYGPRAFEFAVLEECTEDELYGKEFHHIRNWDGPLYNIIGVCGSRSDIRLFVD